MTFGMIMENQNMVKKQNCVICIQILIWILVYIKADDIYKEMAEDWIRFSMMNKVIN